MADLKTIAEHLNIVEPSPYHQAVVDALNRLEQVESQRDALFALWHQVNSIMEATGIPDEEDLGHLCNLSILVSEKLSIQEREDLGAAMSQQYAANTIRKMVRTIADVDFCKDEVLGYANSLEDKS